MSKHNKANKQNYVQAGRLTPDERAREAQKQGGKDRVDPEKIRAKGEQKRRGAPGASRPRSAPEE